MCYRLGRGASSLLQGSLAILSIFSLAACGFDNKFDLAVVDWPDTAARQQSIGNCWAYATIGWVESLVLSAPGAEPADFSEAYLTLRHFEEQLREMSAKTPEPLRRLDPSGTFASARGIIAAHGLLRESDFGSNLPGSQASDPVEVRAFNSLDRSLKSGQLKLLFDKSKSKIEREQLITAELDAAFGVSLAEMEKKIVSPDNVIIGSGTGKLGSELYRWEYHDFPLNLADLPNRDAVFPYRGRLDDEQEALVKRARRALSSHRPILVGWLVDLNAMGQDGVFRAANWKQGGDQGMHLTVVKDYTAWWTDPATGTDIHFDEGELPPEAKKQAAENGRLESFIVKNSWGPLPGRTYKRFGNWGYSRLEADFLFSWLPRKESDGTIAAPELVLRNLILPTDTGAE